MNIVKDDKDNIVEIVLDQDGNDHDKNIVVEINEKDLTTTIFSDYSPEKNIEYLL